MLLCVKHIFTMGKNARDDSEVHSHFGNYTRAKLRMFIALVGKANNHQIGPMETIKNVLKCRCLKCPCIVHLDVIGMSYDQKKRQE